MEFMHQYARKQKILEINPRSPLIEGLLRRVKQLPEDEEERDEEAEAEKRMPMTKGKDKAKSPTPAKASPPPEADGDVQMGDVGGAGAGLDDGAVRPDRYATIRSHTHGATGLM